MMLRSMEYHPMTMNKKPRRMAREPRDCASAIIAPEQAGDAATPIVPAPARVTKQSMLIAMLGTEAGTALDAIVEATSWQTHTVRAALTGLRKTGHAIERSSVDGKTRYRIIPPAAAQ